MVIEQRLAFGKQLVFLLTPKGPELAEVLRAADFLLAELKGRTREGDLKILCVEIARREVQKLIRLASAVDERCVVIVHDIRRSDFAWRAAAKGNRRKLSWLFALGGTHRPKGSPS